MHRLRKSVFLLCAAVVILSARSADAGPISLWYLTAGDQGTNWTIQGATTTSFAQEHPESLGEYAIAVSGDVRTLGNGNNQVNLGSQYSLSGVYTGVDYAYPLDGVAFYDGTTDGTSNYSVDYNTGTVYQMSRDWTSPVSLFATQSGNLGITYDSTNNSLWISGFFGSTVTNYSMTGTVLSSFNAQEALLSALALDPADGSLWMGSQSTQGTFYQYSKAGLLLDTETYAALVDQNTLGGEFNVAAVDAPVPEPATLSLLALGLGLIAARHRLRRRS